MARSREEVISEMVDSGLFSDDEIRKAANESNNPSVLKTAWNSLAVPAQKSREGLQMIASAVSPKQEVTGNMARDVAMNLPRIGMETLSQVAPDFISRGSLLTAGALKGVKAAAPLIKGAGKLVARGAEGLSGLEYKTPGVLAEAAADPKLMLSAGKSSASKLYEAAKAETGDANIFKGMYKPEEIVDAAKDYLSKGGNLEPSEALMYRKAIDKLAKSGRYLKDELFSMRAEADAAAKQSENIAMADPQYAKGVKAEALRNILPQNKHGGASSFKTALSGVTATLPLFSPIVQGAIATGLGVGARAAAPLVNNPIAGSAISGITKALTDESKAREYLKKAKGDPVKARALAKADGYAVGQ